MKGFKLFYLLIALAFPVTIFLFLKYFGKNQFDVQPLHVDRIPDEFLDRCAFHYELPYFVPDSVLQNIKWSSVDNLTLFYFDDSTGPLKRIQTEFTSTEVRLLKINSQGIDNLELLKDCFLFVSKPFNLVLVDQKRQIRGYYQSANRDEIDRLILEASIILNKY